jgi:hypothetical protein
MFWCSPLITSLVVMCLLERLNKNKYSSSVSLAFLARVVNNPVVTVMRLAFGFAIALSLSLPARGVVSRQQDATGSANSAGPAQAVPAPPAVPAPKENPTAEAAPITGKEAPESVAKDAKEKPVAPSTSAKPKHRKHRPPTPDDAPRKIVVREGGASEPAAQIAPGITPAEAASQRQSAERLLASTDDRLKQLTGRTLDARKQETVAQIRNYVASARSALREGDARRAGTLAQKAHLLLDDLMKH